MIIMGKRRQKPAPKQELLAPPSPNDLELGKKLAKVELAVHPIPCIPLTRNHLLVRIECAKMLESGVRRCDCDFLLSKFFKNPAFGANNGHYMRAFSVAQKMLHVASIRNGSIVVEPGPFLVESLLVFDKWPGVDLKALTKIVNDKHSLAIFLDPCGFMWF